MPIPGQVRRKRELELYLQARREFEDGFQRSSKGNLWRRWEDGTLTVFRREGAVHFCIVDGDGTKRWRRWEGYEVEEDAISVLAELVLDG